MKYLFTPLYLVFPKLKRTPLVLMVCFLLQGITAFSQAPTPGQALHFDGIDDWVDVQNMPAINAIPVTLEAMVKPEMRSENTTFYPNNILSNDVPGYYGLGMGININAYGSQVTIEYKNGFRTFYDNSILPNVWTHIAVVYNNGNVKTYINGILKDDLNYSQAALNGNTNMNIGKHNNDGGYGTRRFFKGAIDEVRVWNRALCATEIGTQFSCQLNGVGNGLFANYNFDAGFDNSNNAGYTSLNDTTANSGNGTLYSFALTGTTSNWIAPGGTSSVCSAYNTPDINLKGNNTTIYDGDITPSTADHTDFGVITSLPFSRTYTIENTGTSALTVSSITLSGTNAALFGISGISLPAVIASGSSTTFAVNYSPVAAGLHTATINIGSNDCDESTYDFAIRAQFSPPPGAALNFDGVNDWVQIPFNNAFNSQQFTIEGWVKPVSGMNNWARLWGTQNNNHDLVVKTNNTEAFSFWPVINGNYVPAISPTNWTSGQWYHIAGVVDGSYVRLFVNGVQVAATAYTGTVNTDNGVRFIGRSYAASEIFRGNIDEVRFWNRALCQNEIQAHMSCELSGSENALVAYYKLNQGTAGINNASVTTATDAAGGNDPGTLTNFTLNGNTSNWTAPGGVTTGSSCTVFNAPEINIQGNGNTIADGSNVPSATNFTDFGTNVYTRTFTIQNTGTSALTISGTSVTGANASNFSVTSAPSGSVAASGSTTFTVTFSPTVIGNYTAVIHVASNDCDEQDYDFTVKGFGVNGPANVNNGVLTWLDASDVDADGNAGNDPSNASALATWKDKSGNNNDATQLSGQNAGLYTTSVINGKSTVKFAGTNVYNFANIDIRAISNPDVSIVAVYKQGNSTVTGLWGDDNGGWDRFMYSAFGSTNGIASRGPSQSPPYTSIPNSGIPGNVYLFTAMYDGQVNAGVNAGPTNGSSFWFNGSLLGTFTDLTDASAAQSTLRMGWDGDDGKFSGDIAEFIVYNRLLTPCEIQQINIYLSNKYGITFSTATITAGGSTAICPGASVQLAANSGTAYQWNLNGTPISGATSQTYSASTLGSYTCDITTTCGVATSNAINVTGDEIPPALAGNNVIPSGSTGMNVCQTNAPAGPSTTDIAALYSDNCGTVHVDKTGSVSGNGCIWNVTYTYDVYDNSGNHVNPSPTVSYSGGDQSAPTLNTGASIPSGSTGMPICQSAAPAGPSETDIAALYGDNCGNVNVSKSASSSGNNCGWSVTYTYAITDDCGNAVSPSPTVTYSGGDVSAPTLNTGSSIPSGSTGMNVCKSAAPAGPSETDIAALYGDNCGNVNVSKSASSSGNNCGWSVTYTYAITDDCGNAVNPSPTVTYSGSDQTAPTASAQNVSVTLSGGTASVTAAQVNNGSSDNCGGSVNLSLSKTNFTCADIGNNPVTLTVTDACGNYSTANATVTVVGTVPTVSISQNNQPEFCQGGYIILNTSVTGGVNSYQWSTGATTASIQVNASGTYTCTVSNGNGCTATASTTVNYVASNLLSSYTLIANDEVELKDGSLLMSGGAGALNPTKGEVEAEKNSMITAAGTFARAQDIEVKNGSVISTQILTTPTITLPAFKYNPYCNSNNNKTIAQNATVTLTDSVFDKVNLGKGSTVIFTRPVLFINDLNMGENCTIKFTSSCVKISLCKEFNIDKGSFFNPDYKSVVIYSVKKVDVKKASTVVSSIYCLEDIHANGESNDSVTLIGMFIADHEVDLKNTVVYANGTCGSCTANNKTMAAAQADERGVISSEELVINAYPNPSNGKFALDIITPVDGNLQVTVYDYTGKEVFATGTMESHGTLFVPVDLSTQASGYYLVKATFNGNTYTKRMMIQTQR